MSLHIQFTNGSNPYIRFNMDPGEFARELLKWTKRFDLSFIKADGTILYFRAEEKGEKASHDQTQDF